MFNKLAPKLPPSLQCEVGGDAGGSNKSELPRFGASTVACSRGFMYLVYRVAMPVTQNDEKAMLALIAKPSSPKRAGQTLAALDEYIELIQLGARCGIEVAKYSHLRETVRGLLKEAEGVTDEERGERP